jgi:hypothetical protein
MMSCPDRARLQQFLDKQLGEAEHAKIDEHVETCQRCQGELERLTASDVKDLPIPLLPRIAPDKVTASPPVPTSGTARPLIKWMIASAFLCVLAGIGVSGKLLLGLLVSPNDREPDTTLVATPPSRVTEKISTPQYPVRFDEANSNLIRRKADKGITATTLLLMLGTEKVFWGAAFEAEAKKAGQISPQEFAQRYPSQAHYLRQLSWDPTTSKFWDQFNLDPKMNRPLGRPEVMYDDFRLSAGELAVFKKNGFVVSERLGAQSFAEIFYRIYSRDLPVYVSADALLHAWHRTYDAMLEELEEFYLAPSLDQILAGMAASLPEARREFGEGVLAESVTDADYFLAVARSLLAGQPVESYLDQDERVAETLKACAGLQLKDFLLFGRVRHMDFSQFMARGHYENSELLKKYFQAMMWCGRVDLRVAGTPGEASPRELGAAVVLHELLRRSDQFEEWQRFDRLLQALVGGTDSMTFAQLGDILVQANIKSPADLKDLDTLAGLQAEILAGKIGLQHIRGDVYDSPLGPEKMQLPRSFTVLGQKFVVDSWALSKVVYDDVIWNEDKVQRRVPSALDMAFAVLGNDQVVPDLVSRMTTSDGRKFRDRLDYQHNLAAVRNVIDAQEETAWDENVYVNWLACLRELSAPTTDARYPEAMRTRAWAMKALNTQLASWAQLRHDTVLYAKQSYTGVPSCEYPAGFVEAVPHFWSRLEKMTARAAKLLEETSLPDRAVEKERELGRIIVIRVTDIQKKQVAFLRNFSRQVAILEAIARKELAQMQLTTEELKFLKEVIQLQREGSGSTSYGGWYPGLFYKGRTDSGVWDAIVADVHTDPPAPAVSDPGCVLHQGVGNVELLLIAVDSGEDHMVYAGPVLSHYEFEMPAVVRKSDAEWRQNIRDDKLPPRPEWTRSYLVPGESKAARNYFHPDDDRHSRQSAPKRP